MSTTTEAFSNYRSLMSLKCMGLGSKWYGLWGMGFCANFWTEKSWTHGKFFNSRRRPIPDSYIIPVPSFFQPRRNATLVVSMTPTVDTVPLTL